MALRINPRIRRLVDSATGEDVESGGFTRPIGLSPHSGKPVIVEYDLPAIKQDLEEGGFGKSPGLFRYASLLPVSGAPAHYAPDVGCTTTVRIPALADRFDVDLFFKNEGTNPSGSFKDRGLSVGIALGVACGAKRFCLPTQGNAGVAASLFSARLGLAPALVYMPQSYEGGMYHRECALFGATVRFFGANIAAAGKKMREDVRDLLQSGEYVDISTFFEPGRLEGKKTMGIEIWEFFRDGQLPDWILYPTGGGTGLVGIWKAFSELVGLGLLNGERLPRLVAVQAEGCAPVVRAFDAGRDSVEPVESKGTIADGLDVPGAIMGHRMLAVLRESGGTAIAVKEESIRKAFVELGRTGVAAGYESAALLAALEELRTREAIARGGRVLILNTSGPTMALAAGK